MSYTGANATHAVHDGQRSVGSVPHTSRVVLGALLFVAFVVGGAGTYAVLRYRAPRAQAAVLVSSAHVTSAVVDVKTAEPETVSVEALPAPSIPASMTVVSFPRGAIGHRVWIDDRLAGSDDKPLELRCGRHTIKIGSQGKARELELPCGRELTLE